jgi:hypothetical protein
MTVPLAWLVVLGRALAFDHGKFGSEGKATDPAC